MTRKRFVKLMMADGWCRDMANDYANTLIKLGNFSYRDAWSEIAEPELIDWIIKKYFKDFLKTS